MKGQMVGSCGLDGDIHIAHSVHASSLQSDVSTRRCGCFGIDLLTVPSSSWTALD